MIYSSLFYNLSMDLMLIQILRIPRIPRRQSSGASTPTDHPLILIRIWCSKPMLLRCPIIRLLSRIAVLILVSIDPSLPVLAHRDELLVGVPLALRRHVFLQNLSLNLLVVVVHKPYCSVVILISGGDAVPGLLAGHMMMPARLPVVHVQFTFSPVPIHQ